MIVNDKNNYIGLPVEEGLNLGILVYAFQLFFSTLNNIKCAVRLRCHAITLIISISRRGIEATQFTV